jgi:hypothetical protein
MALLTPSGLHADTPIFRARDLSRRNDPHPKSDSATSMLEALQMRTLVIGSGGSRKNSLKYEPKAQVPLNAQADRRNENCRR